jgi:nicotinamide-nucleotide amidase
MRIKKTFRVEIIAVGTELLTPYYQDTNSLYLTQHLNDLGLTVSFKTIVGDRWDDLQEGIKVALNRANLIITIGGLGPTQDDQTREVIASVLGRDLVFKKEILDQIKARFKHRKLIMTPTNKKQAYIISGAEFLENKNGTAPGLWIEEGRKVILLLPGPPQELKPMFESFVLPRLQAYRQGFGHRMVLKITGLTESKIESLISDLYPTDPDLNLTVLAYPDQIELHITGHAKDGTSQAKNIVIELEKKISMRLGENIFSRAGEELEEVVGKLLASSSSTVSVAESCTGGLLGHRITNVPGSSSYFSQGVQVYSNEAKAQILGVPRNLITTYGAVSAEVAESMARQIRKIADSDYGLAITGIAGPTGGSQEKPVGLVFTALAWKEGVQVDKNLFLGNREMIKYRSSQKALDMLRRHFIRYSIEV